MPTLFMIYIYLSRKREEKLKNIWLFYDKVKTFSQKMYIGFAISQISVQ